MIAQIELVLQQLAKNGGGWGTAFAMLWLGWRIWKEVKPNMVKWLDLRQREVAIHERNAKAREDGVAVARETNKGIHGLTTSINGLSDGLSKAMNNGFKRITEKIESDRKSENENGGT